MEFNFNDYSAYIITKEEDGYIISNNMSFIMEAEQVEEVAKGLLKYARKHKKDIEMYNLKRDMEIKEELCGWNKKSVEEDRANREKRKKEMKKGYVYLFECGGKYKIGYSKNVEKRIKQLDYRPYNIKLLAKSKFLSNAYEIEQELHQFWQDNRITGEWYEFEDDYINEVIDEINNLEDWDE